MTGPPAGGVSSESRYHRGMDTGILVGTEAGLWQLGDGTAEPAEPFAGREVTALARDGARTWALIEGQAGNAA